nr:putative C-type lectin domain family 20 member A [Misgurnus anguillicaudatus]
MEKLMILLLLSGLGLFIQSISCQYILIKEKKTWDDAQAYCRHNHIDLATVQGNEDRTELQAAEPALTSVAWIGLYNDINGWRWSYQDENPTFTAWKTRKPNNGNGKQECVAFEFNEWVDGVCSEPLTFLCYDENQMNANKFVFINTLKSWPEAQKYCRQHHTDLATVHNQAEHDQLVRMKNPYKYAWHGLFRHSWKWSDGKQVNTSLINWMTGQPNVIGQNRPCVNINHNGRISDQFCSDTLPFICLTYAKQQIVKIEIKSDQNLNDPAVLDILLQRIKTKLKDHGIEDTRLTWRVKLDGNVFSPKLYWKDSAKKKYVKCK